MNLASVSSKYKYVQLHRFVEDVIS